MSAIQGDKGVRELVKLGADVTYAQRQQIIYDLSKKLKVSESDMYNIMNAVQSTFDEMATEYRRALAKQKLTPRKPGKRKDFMTQFKEFLHTPCDILITGLCGCQFKVGITI